MEWILVRLLEFVVETEKSASVPPSFRFLFRLSPLPWGVSSKLKVFGKVEFGGRKVNRLSL